MKAREALIGIVGPLAAITMAAGLQTANATTVATIVGAYDDLVYDTPELIINNTSGGTFTNAQMVLYGYQSGTLNYGVSETVPLASMGGGTTYLDWGYIPGADASLTGGNLTAYDYDDEWGNTPAGYTNSVCIVTTSYCSDVGNFKVTFTATISGGAFDGNPVYSVFSPTTNYTGGFVGWEGLDPNGVSESVYDEHSGTFSGTMAIVQIGTVPPVPELSTWAMMLLGFTGLGIAGYRRMRKASVAFSSV